MSGQEDERERLLLLMGVFKDSLNSKVDGYLDKDATKIKMKKIGQVKTPMWAKMLTVDLTISWSQMENYFTDDTDDI